MRWLSGLLMGFFVASASAQESSAIPRLWYGALVTGYGGTTELHDFSACWVVSPPTERAVMIGQVLGLGANPLTSGWAQYALGGQQRSIPMVGEPAERVNLLGGALAMYGGSLPFKPWEHVNPPPQEGQAGGANGPGGNLQRLTTTTDGLPLISTAVQLGNSLEDGSVTIGITGLEEPFSVTASLPNDGWWFFGLSEEPILTGDDLPLDWQIRESDGPFVIGLPSSGWPSAYPSTGWMTAPPMTTVATPEPSSLLMGFLGLAGSWFYARRSVKSA